MIKNGRAAEPSRLELEMVKPADEAGLNMITDLISQITAEGYSIRQGTSHYYKLL